MKTYEFYDNMRQNDVNYVLKKNHNHTFLSAKCMLSEDHTIYQELS